MVGPYRGTVKLEAQYRFGTLLSPTTSKCEERLLVVVGPCCEGSRALMRVQWQRLESRDLQAPQAPWRRRCSPKICGTSGPVAPARHLAIFVVGFRELSLSQVDEEVMLATTVCDLCPSGAILTPHTPVWLRILQPQHWGP